MDSRNDSRNRHAAVMTWRAVAARLDAVTTTDQQIRPNTARRHAGTTRGANSARNDAVRDVLSVAPGILPFGLALGIVIASTSMGDAAGFLGAPLVYGGSAQLTATTMFQQGAGLLAVVGSAVTVNARLLLYSASLAPRFSGQPRWFRLTAPHFIIDQTYLSALGRPGHAGRRFRTYWLWLGLGVMAVWSAAVGMGVLIGPRLPSLPHLTLAGTALFVGMLMPRVCDRPSVAAAITAGAVAPLAAQVAPSIAVVAGTAAGMVAGMAARREPSR
jgi:predicted branched-subunit amino acid permease